MIPRNLPSPKQRRSYVTESFPVGRAISEENMYLVASEVTTASEVKTEAAGEIGCPN